MTDPLRGEIWTVDLNPTLGREQAGSRPALIVSVDPFNQGPADLVVAIPITSKSKNIPFHVEILPPEGGLSLRSFVKCEDLRSISKQRLARRVGQVNRGTMARVEERLRILLSL